MIQCFAMTELGNGLSAVKHFKDALPVREAELSMLRRVGAYEGAILNAQGNIAMTYGELGDREKALSMERDVYSGHLRLYGDHINTCLVAENYALSLLKLERFKEAKSVLRKTISMAQRVRGRNDATTLKVRWNYAMVLYLDPGATLDELREAVSALEEIEPSARRTFGGTHPHALTIEHHLRESRAALRAHDTSSA